MRSSDNKKSPSLSSGTNKGNETSVLTEEAKEGTPIEDCPCPEVSESIQVQCQLATHLLELMENSNKGSLMNVTQHEDKGRSVESKLLSANMELETLKSQLKDLERDNKQKSKLLEANEEKLERLSKRLASSPWTPYALTQMHHFDKQSGPHDCQCIICGGQMKTRESLGNSPEVFLN